MLCQIADLITEIPEAGGMSPRCREYLTQQKTSADITICADRYQIHKWPTLSESYAVYMESGVQFYRELLRYDGMMLHASAVAVDGQAYLFSGPCGMGKSTHARLWKQLFGDAAQIFNDDKPALRRLDGQWFAYGTPWCGKDGININMKVPLAGICFLRRGDQNTIRQLGVQEATTNVISQTLRRFRDAEKLDLMLANVEKLVLEVPIYELFNKPELAAAQLSYETMHRRSEEDFL